MSHAPVMRLEVLPGRFAVARLGHDAPVPAWAAGGPFTCQVRTPDELSLVAPEAAGVLAELARSLAAAQVSILAISTFDTDDLLVRSRDLETAVDALRGAGPYA